MHRFTPHIISSPRLEAPSTALYDGCCKMRFLVLFAAASIPALAAGEFSRRLYPTLEKAQCRLCHNDNGVASATRLRFPPASATEPEIDRFGLRLRALVDRANPEQSLLLRKPTNRLSHTGGERIKPGSTE